MRPFLSALLLIFVCPSLSAAQSASPESKNLKVCVAKVANTSTASAPLERLTERLAKSLKSAKLEVTSMDSSTTKDRKLRLTRLNVEEADNKQCDYTLLTQIVETRVHPAAPPTIRRDGAIVPSVDAADPLGGNSGPVYRENMEIAFALFRASHYDPVTDSSILERASANVSDTFLTGMDRIANRVSHDLKKK